MLPDLAFLSKEFASLCENLEVAVSEQEVEEAWAAFDRDPVAELIELHSALCLAPSRISEVDKHVSQSQNEG